MSRLVSSPLRLVWLGLLLVVNAVHGQTYCQNAEVLSRTNLAQASQNCAVNVSSCVSRATCTPGCALNTPTSAITTCTDACTYTSAGYTVSRRYTSGFATFVASPGGTPVNISVITLGFSHTFTSGPAQGNFIYTYGGTIDADLRVVPERGASCGFLYNGVDCSCTQRFCDASRTRYANRINCTNVPGGAVIDECVGVTLPTPTNNKTMSTLEILYATPRAVCQGINVVTGSPATAPTKAPTKAPVKVAAPTAPVSQPSMAFAPMVGTAPTVPAPAVAAPAAPAAPMVGTAPTAPTRARCGLFKLSVFCLNGCGLIGRLLFLCNK